ncbi:MAG: methyltransferase domain-containing protein [Acidobacteria bacterium]|nr:methyltransferase domain-containing protein [Acidobacteriota bacterium]
MAAQILEEVWAFGRTQVLGAALELGVFESLARRSQSAAAVARATGCDLRGIRHLLDALVSMRLLNRQNQQYRLGVQARPFLLQSGERYLGGMALQLRTRLEEWQHLVRVLRTGRPATRSHPARRASQFYRRLVAGLFPLHYAASREAARKLGVGRTWKKLQILDVAAGAAPWSLGFALTDPEAQVTILDFPPVLSVARSYARRLGCERRCRFRAGDLTQVDFGNSIYDVVLLGYICHSLGERGTRQIFAKCFRALRPRGRVILADAMPHDDRKGPVQPLLIALNTFLRTPDGDAFTQSQYRAWFRRAGFRNVTTLQVGLACPLLVARK